MSSIIFKFFRKDITDLISPVSNIDANSNKLGRLLFHSSFFVSFLAVYVLSIQGLDWMLKIKNVLMVLVTLGLGLFMLLKRRVNFWYVILSLIVIGYVNFQMRMDALAEFVLLSWMIFVSFFKIHTQPSNRLVFYIGFGLCLIVGIHFFFLDSYGRETIGGLDPNYSSFLIYLILPFAIISQSRILHIFILTLGLMTHSRGFFVAYATYIFVWGTSKFFVRYKLTYKQFVLIFLFILLLVFGFSYFEYFKGLLPYEPHHFGPFRVFQIFKNPSDFERWKANVIYFQSIFKNLDLALFGLGPINYLETVYRFLPHNLPLLEIATHGLLLGTAFILIFFGVLKKFYVSRMIPFYFGLMIYWLFLGIEIGAIYHVFLVNLLLFLGQTNVAEPEIKDPNV